MIETRSGRLPEPPVTGFPAFCGRWRVLRRILDRRNGAIQHFAGVAFVETDRFAEEGEFDTGSSRFVSRRTYRLVLQERRLSVRFANDADFISLSLDARQTVTHHCGADVYLGTFFFRSPDCWAEFWRVRGPRKNYVSLARYERDASLLDALQDRPESGGRTLRRNEFAGTGMGR